MTMLMATLPHGVHWPRTVRSAPQNPLYIEGNVVSQNINPTQTPEDGEELAPITSSEPVDTALSTPTAGAVAEGEDESTIGTGTSMALGCIAGTVVLIIFGLLFLALSRLV